MDVKKRAELESAGYVVVDHAHDWLGLTPEERQLVDLRVRLVGQLQKSRARLGLTRRQMAARTGLTVQNITEIDAGGLDVTLEKLFHGLFALGGTLADVMPEPPANGHARPTRRKKVTA